MCRTRIMMASSPRAVGRAGCARPGCSVALPGARSGTGPLPSLLHREAWDATLAHGGKCRHCAVRKRSGGTLMNTASCEGGSQALPLALSLPASSVSPSPLGHQPSLHALKNIPECMSSPVRGVRSKGNKLRESRAFLTGRGKKVSLGLGDFYGSILTSHQK